ncbi:peptidoglycan-binding domain-containing protein [Lentisalinibacter sediminis]|uniref:peptidoglycan-binding domain-containing protein n=1 Tax=Lentisalinibacter sediminis TaxID=2992237 RepID=UPI003869A26B
MKLAILYLSLGLLAAGPAFAGDGEARHAVRGAGVVDCASFLAEKGAASDAYVMMGGWIDGYITAYNQLSESTYDITTFQSTELLVRVIEGHCEDNPEHRLFTVVSSIAEQLREQRLREASPILNVRVDGKATRLYRETVARMQARLGEEGHYDGKASGNYDAATLEAVQSYQASIGYEPTGFPDQATLWKLFAGTDS